MSVSSNPSADSTVGETLGFACRSALAAASTAIDGTCAAFAASVSSMHDSASSSPVTGSSGREEGPSIDNAMHRDVTISSDAASISSSMSLTLSGTSWTCR